MARENDILHGPEIPPHELAVLFGRRGGLSRSTKKHRASSANFAAAREKSRQVYAARRAAKKGLQ